MSYGDEQGWTLMEVMVTVGILGILGSIGLGSLQAWRARSLQAEVKSNLTSLAMMERSYLIHARSYTSCLRDVGFEPVAAGSGRRSYAYGMGQAEAEMARCGAYGNQNCRQGFSKVQPNGAACRDNAFFIPALQTQGTILLDTVPEFEAVFQSPVARPFVEQTRFRLCGAGHIRAGRNADIWCVTDDAGLRLELSGL